MIILFFIFFGFVSGRCAGKGLLSGLMSGNGITAFFFFRPGETYIHTSGLLGSMDENERIAGYYSLLDSKIINPVFLKERFTMESSPAVRHAILWIMGQGIRQGGKPADIVSAYDELYEGASPDERDEMVRALKKYPDMLGEFTKRHNIPVVPEKIEH